MRLLLALARLCRRLLVLTGTLAALWLAGLLAFVSIIPDQVDDPTLHTDAIVVLTGGSERLKTAVDLLRAGTGDVLFVSGVFPDTSVTAILHEAGATAADEALRPRIVIGRMAGDTVGNAVETAIWVKTQNIHSIRLVTSAYHMPRSMLEFAAVLPPDVAVIAHPVFAPSVARDGWWHHPGTLALFSAEYTKYLLARLRQGLPDT